jgi:hypothetical protein
MKIVINTCYGGFGLSERAMELYAKKKDWNLIIDDDQGFIKHYYINEKNDNNYFYDREIARNDSTLIEVIEELGSTANGSFAKLKIIDIPDDVEWDIEEYDGMEWVAEKHRTWS